MSLYAYLAAVQAEAELVNLYALDETDNGAGDLNEPISGNDIPLSGTESGTFQTVMDEALGLVGISIDAHTFAGGTAGTITRLMVIELVLKIHTTPSGFQRIVGCVDDTDNLCVLSINGGVFDLRNEVGGSAVGVKTTPTYGTGDGLLHVFARIKGTGTGDREIFINGVKPTQVENTSGIGNSGSTDDIALGGNGSDGQMAAVVMAHVALYEGADVGDIDPLAHYKALTRADDSGAIDMATDRANDRSISK